MNEVGNTTNPMREALIALGFRPDASLYSDGTPRLSFDFGNFSLAASFVLNRSFQEVVLFTGVLSTPRGLSEVCFEVPRTSYRRELIAAWIVWNLDRSAGGPQFIPTHQVEWLDLGRRNQHQLPWEVWRAERAALEAAYAARPHCSVDRRVLRLALNTLADALMEADPSESVIISFNGQVLSFVCHGLDARIAAFGNAWPSRYRLSVSDLKDLPTRLMRRVIEVGIWKEKLEIDRYRYAGLQEIE